MLPPFISDANRQTSDYFKFLSVIYTEPNVTAIHVRQLRDKHPTFILYRSIRRTRDNVTAISYPMSNRSYVLPDPADRISVPLKINVGLLVVYPVEKLKGNIRLRRR